MEICAAGHGESGKGNGPAAAGLPVKPHDHTDTSYMRKLTDQEIFEVIKCGGAALGKSPVMPQWGLLLSDTQIHNLVAYIRTLARHPQ